MFSQMRKSLQKIKKRGAEAPAPRFSRMHLDYDLHEMAGGSPLTTISAPNVHPSSKRGREVCDPAGKSNVPIQKCGSKRAHYAPSRKEKTYSSSSESSA